MKQKNLIAAVFAAALVLQAHAAAAEFSDFPTDWSAAALTRAVNDGLLSGANGKINPSGKLTRAEMAAIMNRAFGATEQAKLDGYQDVSPQAWYYTELAKAVQMGTFQGGDGKLLPDREITREQAFTVLARAFALEDGKSTALNGFTDGDQVSDWAKGAVAALVEGGYVGGAQGKLNPQSGITRAEFAQVMCNLVGMYIDAPQTVTQAAQGNLVVRASGATLQGMTVSGDLVLADGIGTGDATLEKMTVDGRLIVRGGGADSIHLIDTKIKGGVVLKNPNTATRLEIKDSALDQVEATSDLIVDGDIAEIRLTSPAKVTIRSGKIGTITVDEQAKGSQITVESGAQVESIAVNGAQVEISGKGTVKTVQADANDVTVTTPNTEVTAASGTSGVKAGGQMVKAGQKAKISADGTDAAVSDIKLEEGETPKSDKPGSGTVHRSMKRDSSASGSSSDTASGTPDQTKPSENPSGKPEADLKLAVNLIDLKYAQYVVITFAENTKVTEYTVEIDGQTINERDLRYVDHSGRIVKWEPTNGWKLNDAHTVTVTRKADGSRQTVPVELLEKKK